MSTRLRMWLHVVDLRLDSISGCEAPIREYWWTAFMEAAGVPSVLRNEILQELHACALEGHLGEDKTIAKIQERFYWPGLRHDVIQWLRTCPACATRKSPPQKNRAPLQMIASGFPMQIVAVDILGPLPESTAGNLYILVVGDYFTK